jgi:hypothetical protein
LIVPLHAVTDLGICGLSTKLDAAGNVDLRLCELGGKCGCCGNGGLEVNTNV